MRCQWEENPQTCPSSWDYVTLPLEDRATAIGIMHKDLVKIARVLPEISCRTDRHIDRETDRQTDATDRNTLHRSRGRSKYLTHVQSLQPQKATTCSKTRHTTDIVKIGPQPLPNTQIIYSSLFKSYALQCFSISQTPQKYRVPCGHLHLRVIHVPWTHLTRHSNLHLDWFSRITQLTAESPYTLQCELEQNAINA